MSPNKLTCLLFPDLLPWERDAFLPLVSALSARRSLDIQEVSGDPRAWMKQLPEGAIWIAARDWQGALRSIPSRFTSDVFVSALGFAPAPQSLVTLFLRRLRPAVRRRVQVVVHSRFSLRFHREMERLPESQVSYLPLPFLGFDTPPAPRENPVIGAVGAFGAESNFHYFLNVAHYIARQRSDVRFALHGVGPLSNHLESVARELGLAERVEIINAKEATAPPRFDLLLYPPLRNEHFIPVLMAASAGVPALCSEVPGIEELISDGKDGFVVPMNETRPMGELALRLLADKSLRGFFGERLKEKLSRAYALDRLVGEYERLFFGRGANARSEVSRAA